MEIHFELNIEIELRENYFFLKKELETQLPKITSDDKEINRIKNATLDGFELQDYENHILAVKIIYLVSLNSVEIIWTFPITEQTQEVIQYCETMNRVLETEGNVGIRSVFKTILRVDNRKYRSLLHITSLLHRFKNPIHITKGNTKIDFKQYYSLNKKS